MAATREHSDSFKSSVRVLLIFGQICGLLPVQGIFDSRYTFKWRNLINVYVAFISGITLFFDMCYTLDNFKANFRIDVFASTVFYTVCLLTTALFLRIAFEFAQITSEFTDIENQMSDYGYPKGLGIRIKLFLFTFFFLATVEHGSMVCLNFSRAWNLSYNSTESFGELFYAIHFPPVHRRFSYSGFVCLMLFWSNIICTFNWNFIDFFLICLSSEISERFSQINSRLKTVCRAANAQSNQRNGIRSSSPEFGKLWSDYNHMCLLTRKMDDRLGKIILTAFFSDMYHLSLQLVRSLKLSGTLLQRVYFYFSLLYLITRLLLVLVFISKIHEETKKPAALLFSLKNSPKEADRLLHQVITDDVAFTGNKFFIIDRKFVISVVGTILTYQAFLLQMNSLNE